MVVKCLLKLDHVTIIWLSSLFGDHTDDPLKAKYLSDLTVEKRIRLMKIWWIYNHFWSIYKKVGQDVFLHFEKISHFWMEGETAKNYVHKTMSVTLVFVVIFLTGLVNILVKL